MMLFIFIAMTFVTVVANVHGAAQIALAADIGERQAAEEQFKQFVAERERKRDVQQSSVGDAVIEFVRPQYLLFVAIFFCFLSKPQ